MRDLAHRPGHRALFHTVLLLVASTPLLAQAQLLSDSDVVRAIQIGSRGREIVAYTSGSARSGFVGSLCRSSVPEGTCAFGVIAQGPFARIASAAAEAKKKYLPFSPESVTTQLRAPLLTITATPTAPKLIGGDWQYAPEAQHIVLQLRIGDMDSTVQPVKVETFPVTWSNVVGGQFSGQGVIAYFAEESLPKADFDIVVITSGKESRYRIRGDDRDNLR
jgi:hypothetical protein